MLRCQQIVINSKNLFKEKTLQKCFYFLFLLYSPAVAFSRGVSILYTRCLRIGSFCNSIQTYRYAAVIIHLYYAISRIIFTFDWFLWSTVSLSYITDRFYNFTEVQVSRVVIALLLQNCFLLYTYWDLHTEKPQSKFSLANRCKPINCRVSLFPHVRKAIRPIRSRVSCFFPCEPYDKLKFSFKAGWRGFVHRTSHRFASLKRANSFYWHFFHG